MSYLKVEKFKWVKGRNRSCRFLRIFTYTVRLGYSRIKECPVGARNTRKASLKIRRNLQLPLVLLSLTSFLDNLIDSSLNKINLSFIYLYLYS